jgi:retron-type reverse transcriptase
VRWEEYESGLEDRLVDLHSRVHRGRYRAQPSRRVFIPKADGQERPLGVAALEDKIVQQAGVTILEPDHRQCRSGEVSRLWPLQTVEFGGKWSVWVMEVFRALALQSQL